MFESEVQLNHRFEVLDKLNTLVKEWIKDVTLEKNMPEQVSLSCYVWLSSYAFNEGCKMLAILSFPLCSVAHISR